MKAVIMAGGEGTRLRPLSLGLPKPMVSLLDKPVLSHILKLLKNNGVTDACLTLRYMPDSVTEFLKSEDFGINLSCNIERIPLGTAGGVKNCAGFTGESDFIVISGDCVCDFDLKALMKFHKEKEADATLALYEHPEPLEYGLVVTKNDGRIVKFLEKPPWESVITNRINTGIYILSQAALEKIPNGTAYDFGKDLFPKLLSENRPIYGLPMSGYWCDIGSPSAYLKCCGDVLDGKASLTIGAKETERGVYSNSLIPEGVVVTPPVYVGSNVRLSPGAAIGPRTVIGNGSTVLPGATVSDSVIMSAAVLEGAYINGAIVCSGSVIGRGAAVREESVIGEDCFIGDNSVVSQSVLMWPGRKIPPSSNVRSSITHGMIDGGPGFTSRGVISGSGGAEITPAFALSLGSAAASYGRVGIGCQGGAAARIIADSVACGVCGGGGSVLRFDCGLPSAVSFAGMCFALPMTVAVTQEGENVDIAFFGSNGGLLPHDSERKLLSAASDRIITASAFGHTDSMSGLYEIYSSAAARYAGTSPKTAKTLVVSVTGDGAQNRALRKALTLMGIQISDNAEGAPGFEVGKNGMTLSAYDENGRRLSPERLLILTAAIEFRRGHRELAALYEAPAALDALAGRYGARVYRLGRDGARAENLYEKLRPMRDGVFAGALICGFLDRESTTLSAMAAELPRFSLVSRELPVKKNRSEIMNALASAVSETAADFSEGILLKGERGSIRVTPSREKSALLIKSESFNEEMAGELCVDLEKMLRRVDNHRD